MMSRARVLFLISLLLVNAGQVCYPIELMKPDNRSRRRSEYGIIATIEIGNKRLLLSASFLSIFICAKAISVAKINQTAKIKSAKAATISSSKPPLVEKLNTYGRVSR